MNKFFW